MNIAAFFKALASHEYLKHFKDDSPRVRVFVFLAHRLTVVLSAVLWLAALYLWK